MWEREDLRGARGNTTGTRHKVRREHLKRWTSVNVKSVTYVSVHARSLSRLHPRRSLAKLRASRGVDDVGNSTEKKKQPYAKREGVLYLDFVGKVCE